MGEIEGTCQILTEKGSGKAKIVVEDAIIAVRTDNNKGFMLSAIWICDREKQTIFASADDGNILKISSPDIALMMDNED